MRVRVTDWLRRHPAYWYIVRGLLVVIALALVFQLVHLWQGYRYGSPGTNDFVEYWSAGQLLKAGESPYDFEKLYKLQLELGSPHEFPIIMWNPPWLLIWIFPLLLPAFPIAAVAWLALNWGLNPTGYRVFAYVATVAGDPVSQKIVLEWQPPKLADPAGAPFFAFLGLGVTSLVWARRRPGFADVTLFGTFAALAFLSLRNVVWFTMVAAPILATHLPSWPVPALLGRWLDRVGRKRQPAMRPGLDTRMNYGVVLILVGMTVLLSPWVRPTLWMPGLTGRGCWINTA